MINFTFFEIGDGEWKINYTDEKGSFSSPSDFPSEFVGVPKLIRDYLSSRKTAEEIAYEKAVELVTSKATDEEKLQMLDVFKPFRVGERIESGHERVYNNRLYRAIQTHDTQADWKPGQAPSLWVEVRLNSIDPTAKPDPYKQPLGAHDAYNPPDKILWTDNHVYECLIPNTVHSPAQYAQAWKDIGEWIDV